MASFKIIRDPLTDHLLTPQNVALVIIDFQPVQVDSIQSGPGRESHGPKLGVRRLIQAGGKPVSWVQLICELQRDWNRERTTPGFADILFAVEGH